MAVTAVLCLFGLKQWGQSAHPWLAQHTTFTNITIGCVVLAALAMQTLKGECVPCRMRKSYWVVFALYVYALVSLFWTPRQDLALSIVWLHDYPYIITAVLLAPLTIKDLASLRTAMFALAVLGGALMVILLAFGEWGMRGLIVAGTVYEREANPLAIAGLAGCVAGAAMFVPLNSLKWLVWPMRLAVVSVCLVIIVRSGSRGQLIAACAALLLMMPVAYRASRFRGFAAICIALAAFGAAVSYGLSEFIGVADARWSGALATHDAVGRWHMALQLLGAWSHSGVKILLGLGNSASFDPTVVGYYPHNVPLEVLGEEGLIGFALYLYVLWLAGSGLLRAWKRVANQPEMRGLLAALGAAFTFTFLISLKEGNMVGSVYFFLFAIVLGRMPELVRAAVASKTSPFPRAEKIVASGHLARAPTAT
jgi:hypothetical protein